MPPEHATAVCERFVSNKLGEVRNLNGFLVSVINSMRSERVQFNALCLQNTANVWRKNALAALVDVVLRLLELVGDELERLRKPAQEQHRDDGGGVAGHVIAGDHPGGDQEQRVEHGGQGDGPANRRPDPQGQDRERHDAVHGQLQQLPVAPLAFPVIARGAHVMDFLGAVADPGHQPLVEAESLFQRVERIHHLAVQQAEIADIVGDRMFRQVVEKTVEAVRRAPLDGGVGRAVDAARIDHVGARAPLGDHLGNQVGRILQVDIHRDHGGACGMPCGFSFDTQLIDHTLPRF